MANVDNAYRVRIELAIALSGHNTIAYELVDIGAAHIEMRGHRAR